MSPMRNKGKGKGWDYDGGKGFKGDWKGGKNNFDGD